MGYYEGWDNIWCNAMQAGWVCPRCEKFLQMGEEHSCEAIQPEPRIQSLETQQEESGQHIKPR